MCFHSTSVPSKSLLLPPAVGQEAVCPILSSGVSVSVMFFPLLTVISNVFAHVELESCSFEDAVGSLVLRPCCVSLPESPLLHPQSDSS